MVAYSVFTQLPGNNYYISLKAVTYPVRIIKVDFGNYSTAKTFLTVARYDGSNTTGTTADIVSGQRGAPTATAQAKYGTTKPTGTERLISSYTTSASSASGGVQPGDMFYTPLIFAGAPSTIFQSALDIIIAPGNAFAIFHSNPYSPSTTWFEEMRMPWA